MKFSIWFACVLLNSLIIVLLKYSGILLGGIPAALLFYLMCVLARTLCKKWDSYKENKRIEIGKENIVERPNDIEANNICGSHLINYKDTSNTFLQIQAEETVENFEQNRKNQKNHEDVHHKKEKPIKTIFCGQCGSIIDSEKKICLGCEKKYFRKIKSNKFSWLNVILILFLLASIIINIVQCAGNEDLKAQVSRLDNRNVKLDNRNSKLKNRIDELEDLLSQGKVAVQQSKENEEEQVINEKYLTVDIGYFDSLEELDKQAQRNPDNFKLPVHVSLYGIIIRTNDNKIYIVDSNEAGYFSLYVAIRENNADRFENKCMLNMIDDTKNRVLTGDHVIISGIYTHSKKTISDCTYELVE